MPNRSILIEKLDGGLSQANPENLDPSECQVCLNVDYSQILGGFVIRKGTSAINAAALGSPATVYSSLKLYPGGATNYRYTNAGTTQFRNFVGFRSAAANRITGTQFGTQMFMSDGTSMWADDGTSGNGYPWGISPPANAVTLTTGPLASNSLVLFSNTETWTSIAGTQSFDTVIKKVGQASLSIVGDATKFNGSSTYVLATATNIAITGTGTGTTSVLSQGYFTVWVWVSNAAVLTSLSFQIDVNSGDFSTDYYTYQAVSSNVNASLNNLAAQAEFLPDIGTSGVYNGGYNSSRNILAQRLVPQASVPVNQLPLLTNGWTQLTIPITSFQRTGSTPGQGYATVKAFLVGFTASAACTVKFNGWIELGNSQTLNQGTYYYFETFQHRDSSGNLLNESNSSPISTSFQNVGGQAIITTTNTSGTSSFVTHRGFYRIGGNLDQAYMIGTVTYAAGTATLTDTVADLNALYSNIPLATDNNPAPAGYSNVCGPHFDRIFSGSGITLRWTKVNMPHSWPTTNTAPLPGASFGDSIQRIQRFYNQLYIYTLTTVYVLAGSDESSFSLSKTFSKTGTPAGYTVADAGNKQLYLGGKGSNAFGIYSHDGLYDHRLTFDKMEPFFRGRVTGKGPLPPNPSQILTTGIQPINQKALSACSATYYREAYWMAYPSGTNTLCDSVLKMDFSHESEGVPITIYQYSNPGTVMFLDLEEIDGNLVAGGTDGFLYQLETGQSDNGTGITPFWKSKDFTFGDTSLNQKPLWSFQVDANLNGNGIIAQAFFDSSAFFSVAQATLPQANYRAWTSEIKGDTTQIPRRNFSVAFTTSAPVTSEVQFYGIKIQVVQV